MDENTAPAPRLPFEQWAAKKKTVAWLLAAAKALESWPIGREITEAQFDDAVLRAGSLAVK
jgi:hypothetical protein